ncbi:MAG: ADP-ribosylglycohydrolase family protein [Clostridia bacterium]|nr:ADP-ribosylglycohydrolase family protein [Clostridia bacterium]
MNINLNEFRDRVHACWVGKNIGGTMGAPYEGCRERLDIKGFATDPNVIIPNDDLDLQLVWLYAVEQVGPFGLDASKLGEFWLNFISPYWNEYGLGKLNLRRGVVPPMSGDFNNDWRNSNGAWIRTEIWATLAPGCPGVAAKYAIEDAMVDHGTGEGTYAAAFVAALQSYAFISNDLRAMIDAGLKFIPADSRMAQSIRLVLKCYDEKVDYRETAKRVFELNKDIGDGWFEAPSNVSYAVLGLLYGEGDFKKSMIYAINCGDDTDCTGATVGATLGIMHGMAGIPEDWRGHIGDAIETVCITKSIVTRSAFPKTCTELTGKIVTAAPVMLFANHCPITLTDAPTDMTLEEKVLKKQIDKIQNRFSAFRRYTTEHNLLRCRATVDFGEPPVIRAGEEKKITLKLNNNVAELGRLPHYITLNAYSPDGLELVDSPRSILLPHTPQYYDFSSETVLTVRAPEKLRSVNRIVLELEFEGHPTLEYIPVVFYS